MQLPQIGSQPRSFQRAIGEVCMLPLTPLKGGSKTKFVVQSKCATNFFCVKTSSYDTEHKVEFEGDKEQVITKQLYVIFVVVHVAKVACEVTVTWVVNFMELHMKAAISTTKYQIFFPGNFISFLNQLVVISLKVICVLWKHLLFKLWIIESKPCHNF